MQNTTEIRTYRVTWSIDVEATSAAAAASSVARDYLQAGHTATVFNVAPFEMVADNWGMPGEPVEVDTASATEAEDRAAAWGQLEADLMEYELRHDYERPGQGRRLAPHDGGRPMTTDDAPEMIHYRQLGAGYEDAFRRGDRAALISMLDNQIAYLERLPGSLNMWRTPSGLWVDVITVLALARQRRERFNQSNAAGDCWPYRG